MKSTKRVSALKFIQKINQHEIDVLGKSLRSIESNIASLKNESKRLDAEVDKEAYFTSPETATYLADYLKAVGLRQRFLKDQEAQYIVKADKIKDQLMEHFIRVKKFDSPLKKAEDEIRQNLKAEEKQMNDETAQQAHHYRRKAL